MPNERTWRCEQASEKLLLQLLLIALPLSLARKNPVLRASYLLRRIAHCLAGKAAPKGVGKKKEKKEKHFLFL